MNNGRYRKNVAAVITDGAKHILLAKRRGTEKHWQFPQGGVDKQESLEEALIRELEEELGTKHFEILYKSKQVFRYRWRKNLQLERSVVGQEQTYFLVCFLGQKKDLKPDRREFEAIAWFPYEQVLQQCARVRRPIYTRVLHEFSSHIQAVPCKSRAKLIPKPEQKRYSAESIRLLAKFLEVK